MIDVMKVLLLEDDVDLAVDVSAGLRRAGFAVDVVGALAAADEAVALVEYDVLVLDRTVPDGDAVTLVTALRRSGVRTPVLLLTALDAVADRVEGFEHGADDYLVKPFAFAELTARVRALVRRGPSERSAVLRVGEIEIDLPRHRVSRAGIDLSLTAKEFAVLEVLARNADAVVSRSTLIDKCWDELVDPVSNVVDVAVAQLRRRLGEPTPIQTVRGVGYRLLAGS